MILINVKAKPNSKQNEVLLKDDIYNVRLTQPAQLGKANTQLIKILADYFKIPKNNLTIKSGHKNKNKIIEINTNKKIDTPIFKKQRFNL